VLGPLLDLLFPPRCAGCGDGPWPFCSVCISQIVPLTPPWCTCCGLPAEREVRRCRDCPPEEIELARSPFEFNGPVRAAVHRLKFSGWRTVADAFATAMDAVMPRELEVDAITWVPLSDRRLAARGFDQAAALASTLARRRGLPSRRLLARVMDTGAQARRGAAERRAAMEGAFRVLEPPPPHVLLVDDVLTTGSTAAACAGSLIRAGARGVGLITAARAVPGPLPSRYTQPGPRLGLWLPGEQFPGSRCQPQAKRPT
jgi:ComF family protein